MKAPIWVTGLVFTFTLLWMLSHYASPVANNVTGESKDQIDITSRVRKRPGQHERNRVFWRGLQRAQEETDLERRSTMLGGAAESVPLADVEEVLDSLSAPVTVVAAELTELLVRRWAEANASQAASWAARLPQGSLRRNALNQVAIIWAKGDLASAVAWLKSTSAGPDKESATVSLAYETARSDPALAIELAGELRPSPERDELLAHSVSQWAGTDPDVALDWADRVADAPLRQRLLGAVAVALAKKDGFRAATLVGAALAAGDEQSRSAVAVVQRWAEQSPQAAGSWVARFGESEVQDDAARNLVSLWVSFDHSAAETWVLGLPEGRLKNVATTAYNCASASRRFGGMGFVERESPVP
jgi:hypothetical protein